MVSTSRPLADALAAGPVVLDGGLSNQLEAAGHDLGDALWSARLLAEEPEAVVQAHRAYYEAGAQVAITASYQATFEGFARYGIGAERAAELLARSVELAREAARRAVSGGVAGPLYVAASAGPYGAMPADGSEYRGRYGLTVDELVRFHRPRLEVLARRGPMCWRWRRCRMPRRPVRWCGRCAGWASRPICRTASPGTVPGPGSR